MKVAYPLYLDVSMLISVLAAVDDGVPMDGALASLGIDLDGRVAPDAEPTAHNAIAQRHTVASLFDRLRHTLADDIKRVRKADQLQSLEVGDFVELAGGLTRNPVYEFVTAIERLYTLAEASSALAADDLLVTGDARQVFTALRRELDDSPIVESVLRPAPDLAAVVAFQKAFLRHPSLDDLRLRHVHVLGKCVGTLPAGESWEFLRQSFVGHMVATTFSEAVEGFQELSPTGRFPLETQVEGPAVFVVPLAAYV